MTNTFAYHRVSTNKNRSNFHAGYHREGAMESSGPRKELNNGAN